MKNKIKVNAEIIQQVVQVKTNMSGNMRHEFDVLKNGSGGIVLRYSDNPEWTNPEGICASLQVDKNEDCKIIVGGKTIVLNYAEVDEMLVLLGAFSDTKIQYNECTTIKTIN